eukprot:scaffold7670_cov160-Amphora_coffeaeformis.AAC.10
MMHDHTNHMFVVRKRRDDRTQPLPQTGSKDCLRAAVSPEPEIGEEKSSRIAHAHPTFSRQNHRQQAPKADRVLV